ncbi:MAG TPA: SDR family oxidoreductase, partial [Polyangiaceae bacterium]|nr:SDR family oxidoreductase [Polyangiaceae bacterium]
AAAARYGLRFDAARVRVLCGDASSPRFGLSAALWRELGEDLAAVFHSAGVVNMVWPYERLRAGNLVALGEALRLANEGAPKALHHASTLSVFVSAEPAAPRPREDDALEGTTAVYGGYAQSKWAAERLLRLAAVGPAPLACYRLGLLTGAAAVGSGVGAPADQLSLVVAGLARLGRAPRDRAGLRFDVTPVDYAAAALAHIARAGAPSGPGAVATYHLASDEGASADALIEALRAEGVAIEDVEADEWHALGRRQLDGGPSVERAPDGWTPDGRAPDGRAPNESTPDEAVAAALLAFTRPASPADHARRRPLELFPSNGLDFDTTRARGALAGSGIACPAAGADLLRRYVRLALRGGGAA